MHLHLYSSTNLEMNKWNYQSMLWKNSKEFVVSENIQENFQEKHPGKIAFLNKVASYLALTGDVPLWNLWNFRTAFTRNTRECWRLQLFVTRKCFDQNIFSKNISFDFSHLCFGIKWHVLPEIKCITDVQELHYLNKAYCYISNFYF